MKRKTKKTTFAKIDVSYNNDGVHITFTVMGLTRHLDMAMHEAIALRDLLNEVIDDRS